MPLVQPTFFLDPLVNKLTPPPEQVFQFLPMRVRLRFPGIRLRKYFPVPSKHLSIQGVGFGLVTTGFGEGAHPARVDHLHRDFGLVQSAGQQSFVAARWFTEGQGSILIIQMLDQLGDACRGVIEARHGTSGDRNVQVGLAHPRQCRLPLSFFFVPSLCDNAWCPPHL